MKKIILAVLLISSISIYAQKVDWVSTTDGVDFVYNFRSTVDAQGNFYEPGQFKDSVDVDPSSATNMLKSNGDRDILIRKLDANGNLIWAKSLGGPGQDQASVITLDDSNNIYVAGQFSDSVDFNSGPDVEMRYSNGNSDAFVLKLSPNGDFIWVKTYGGSGPERIMQMKMDKAGNLVLGGNIYGDVDMDPNQGVELFKVGAHDNNVISKWNTNGELIWSKFITGYSFNNMNDFDFDSKGNIYTLSVFRGDIFYNGGNSPNLLRATALDCIIHKLDSNGNVLGAFPILGDGEVYSEGIRINAKDEIYILGNFQSDILFYDLNKLDIRDGRSSNGSIDAFVAKYDAAGKFMWVNTISSGGRDLISKVDIDTNGNVHVLSSYSGEISFDDNDNKMSFKSLGGIDLLLTTYCSNGYFLNGVSMGGMEDDISTNFFIDNLNQAYLLGTFKDSVNFNFDGVSRIKTNSGKSSSFCMKMTLGQYSTECSDRGTSSIDKTTAEALSSIKVYPNPTSGMLHIDNVSEKTDYEGFNQIGQIVLKGTLHQGTSSIDLRDLNQGIYLLRIGNQTHRIIKN